jgi:hypothetical protein
MPSWAGAGKGCAHELWISHGQQRASTLIRRRGGAPGFGCPGRAFGVERLEVDDRGRTADVEAQRLCLRRNLADVNARPRLDVSFARQAIAANLRRCVEFPYDDRI